MRRFSRFLGAALAAASLGAAIGGAPAQGSPWHLAGSFGRRGTAGLPVRERLGEPPLQGAPPVPERDRSLLVAGPRGSVFVGGFARGRPGAFLLARVSATGALVRGFGDRGVMTIPAIRWRRTDPPRLFALAGGVLAVGLGSQDDLVAVRVSADGQLVRSFGHEGVAEYPLAHRRPFTIITAAELEPDGDLLAVYQRELPQPVNQPQVPEGQGNGVIRYVRLLPSGALDRSFGTAGFLAAQPKEFTLLEGESGTVGACAEALTPTGALLIAYEWSALEELGPGGEPVPGFAVDPVAQAPGSTSPANVTRNPFHLCHGLSALPGGYAEGAFGDKLTRLTPAGMPDPTFAGTGSVRVRGPVEALAVASGGESFLASRSGGELLVSGVLADGTPDPALGGAAGRRFSVTLPGAVEQQNPTWEILPGQGELTIRVGEELVRLDAR